MRRPKLTVLPAQYIILFQEGHIAYWKYDIVFIYLVSCSITHVFHILTVITFQNDHSSSVDFMSCLFLPKHPGKFEFVRSI